MRRILLESAGSRQAPKHRGGRGAPGLGGSFVAADEPGQDLVALDDALKERSALDPRKGKVVELRFFGGLSVEETAEALKIPCETVMRDWKFAKSWLRRELGKEKPVAVRPLAAQRNLVPHAA